MNECYSLYVEKMVRPTIDSLMAQRFPSGNYPSSLGSPTGDKLIHWCHGAPGWIYTFILAYKVCNFIFFPYIYHLCNDNLPLDKTLDTTKHTHFRLSNSIIPYMPNSSYFLSVILSVCYWIKK